MGKLQRWYYLIKVNTNAFAVVYIFSVAPSLPAWISLSAICLSLPSQPVFLPFSLFLICISIFLSQPVTDSLAPHLSLFFLLLWTPLAPLCLSHFCRCCVLSLETMVIMWRTCPKTFPFLWYCGLITDILVFCLPKCIVVKSLVPVILNLQENQKQLFHSNDLH